MIIYCPRVFVTWRMLKLRENGLNIDYNTICMKQIRFWEKPRKQKFRIWPFGFGSVRVFINRNRTEIRLPHIPSLFTIVIMRPSSSAGGRIMRRTLPVCPSIPLTLPPDTVWPVNKTVTFRSCVICLSCNWRTVVLNLIAYLCLHCDSMVCTVNKIVHHYVDLNGS